ncbi:MAG: ribbon-helix-helix domain-containing protein, partial [Terriglobales bacterium]
IRVDSQTKDRLDKLAKATDRSKSYLVANAIQDFLSINEISPARSPTAPLTSRHPATTLSSSA